VAPLHGVLHDRLRLDVHLERTDGIDHDDAEQVELGVGLSRQDARDLERDETAKRPAADDDLAAGVDGFDKIEVGAGHLVQTAEAAFLLKVRVPDAVHGPVDEAEAVVAEDGAAAIMDEDQGCRLLPGRLDWVLNQVGVFVEHDANKISSFL